ncbi:MAG: PKD domain-containing protein [Bacteroidia bacterium]
MKKILFITFSILFCLTSQAQIITTVVGGGNTEGLLAINSPINQPSSIAVDASGNSYISDPLNHRIRKVNASTGIMTTIVGNGTSGYGGDGFAAIYANLNSPRGITLDSSGNLYIADYGNNRIRKVNANTGIISTVAGNGTIGFSGDGGVATSAKLAYPYGVAIDGLGNLYISDLSNNRIRKVNASTGIISTIAGNGSSVSGGDGGAATNAGIELPYGLAIDNSGNLFIAEPFKNRIRKVNSNSGIISTVAGTGSDGHFGDGGAATAADLWHPTGVAVDSSGNLFIADNTNNKIRKVSASTGIITTVAGTGGDDYFGDSIVATAAGAGIIYPTGVVVNNSGDLYIASSTRILKVRASTGIISTVAGNGGTGGYAGDGSAANTSCLNNPNCIVVDTLGNLFIADYNNHRIRKVNASNGLITTIAGTGKQGYSGDSGAANFATFRNPSSVALDRLGNLYITDKINHRIRKVNASTGIISSIAGSVSSTGFNYGSYGGDGTLATSAQLNEPTSITIDSSGSLYLADRNNHRIRKVNVNTGIITTVAGNGVYSYGGDSAAATNAYIWLPSGVTLDSQGNFYIADQGNHRIRKVNANTGIITTVAGNGISGFEGDGGLAIAANLYSPSSVAVDVSGNLYIASNNKIRKVNVNTGIISTVAGNGIPGFSGDGALAIDANLSDPTGLNFDKFGNLYIADQGNNRIRKIMYFNYIITGNQTICLGKNPDSLMANIPVGGNGTYHYTWLKSTTSATAGFSAIPASNSVNYKPTALTQNTWYRRCVKSGTYTDTSAAVMITVNQNPNPRVGFIINNPTQCLVGNNFSFTDTSSISSGTITRKWNLGTGVNDTSLLVNPNKIYSSANTYAVKLIITSNNGCKDSVTKNIIVNPKPNVAFVVPTLFCLNNSNTSLNLINNSSISSGSLSYNWQFSDNTSSSLLNPIKTISDTGNMMVKLIATSNYNCKDSITKTAMVNFKPIAGYTISNPIQCLAGNNFLFNDTSKIATGIITRKWNFGTGNNDTSSLANPNKSYSTENTFSVTLIVTSNNNCKDTLIKTVTINPKPTANFTINDNSQCLKNNNFIFTNQSTTSFNYLWKFGNGDTSNIVSPNYNYVNAGSYAVKLIVSDNKNCKDSITKNIIVNANAKPNFTINKDTQNLVGNNFVFTNTSTNSSNQLWNFDDSTTSTLLSPIKTYTSFGTKIVKLISNNAANCPDSINKIVFINARPTIGNILGNINPTSTINPYSYSVLSQANVTYNWSVQNGIIQNGQGTNAVSVIWSNSGTGNIFAKITNGYNLSDSTNLAVNITTVGINDLAINSFSQINFKPNPFSTNLEISFTSATKERTKLIITDAIGKEVYEQHFQTKIGDNDIITEDLSTLKPGFYMATLANINGQSKAFKVIKN